MAEAQKVPQKAPQKEAQKVPQKKARAGGITGMIWWAFAAVGAYYVIFDRREHVWDYLPYLLLMACPLLDIFRRYGGHRRTDLLQAGAMTPAAKKK